MKYKIVLTNYFVENKEKLIRFGMFGFGLYFLGLLLMWLFTQKADLIPQKANLFQTIITYTLQFILNAIFTWYNKKVGFLGNIWRVVKFVPAKYVLWQINQYVFSIFTCFELHYAVAHTLTTGMVMALNFLVFDKIIFTKK